MSDNRTELQGTEMDLNELVTELRLLRQNMEFVAGDVGEIKKTLNDTETGLVTRVKVLERNEEIERWHFGMIWAAIVTAFGAALSHWWRM